MIHVPWRLLVGALVVALLGACATPASTRWRTPRSDARAVRVDVQIAAEANGNSPVALSLMVVYDRALLEELHQLTAPQWFAGRRRLLAAHPAGLSEELWEVVPGQALPPILRELRPGAVEGLVFASYASDGARPHRFDPRRPLQLTLGERRVTLGQAR